MPAVQIFLSCVSAEFRSYRDALRHDLDRPNVTVKVQEDFIATGTETLDMLDGYISQCDVVIHLVGDMTGAMARPPSVTAIRQHYADFADRLPVLRPFVELDGPSLPYTQWEAWLALYHSKQLIICAPEETAPRDARYGLDAEQLASQRAHLVRLASVERYPAFRFANADRLAVDVLRSKLLDILAGSGVVRVRKKPAQAPPLPSGFVSRPEVLARGRDHVQPGAAGGLRIVALHGMAGSGKSAMAAAVAVDKTIQSRFPDGVLWASLGLSPDLKNILSRWIQSISDDEHLQFTDPGAARYELQTHLSSRAVLIVIDDLWDADHGTELVVGGSRCAVLVTTRDAAVARACGAAPEDILPIASMTETEARALLAGGEGRTLPDSLSATADEVARAVGWLPLALKLAAAQAADGITWEEIRADLESEAARLETLDMPGVEEFTKPDLAKQHSLLASLAMSVRRLLADRRRQLIQLSVLRRGAVLTPAAAAIVWALNQRDARDTLRYFHGRGLLDSWSGGGFKLHDTVHALARRLITEPVDPPPDSRLALPGLGKTAAAAHAELLDAYMCSRVSGRWHSLADDGYIHQNLVWHLERAERLNEVHVLLDEVDEQGSNGWFTVRERLGQPDGYLDDLRTAARIASGERSIRYALMLASIGSLATVPPALLRAMIRNGLWTPAFGVYARTVSDPSARALSIAALAEVAPDTNRDALLREAIKAIHALDDSADDVISVLAPRFARFGYVEEALDAARRLSGQPRAAVLAEIAGLVPSSARAPIFSEAVAAGAESGPLFRAAALAAVAPNLDDSQLRHLLLDCEQLPDASKENAIATLLPRLAELGSHDEAVAMARAFHHPPVRAGAFASLASVVAEPVRTELIREALATLAEIDDDAWGKQLVDDFPALSPVARSVLLFSLSLSSSVAEAVASLPGTLSPDLQRRAVEVITARPDDLEVARAVAAVASRLGDAEREMAVRSTAERVRAGDSPATRAAALAELIDAFALEQRAGVAQEALALTEGQFVLQMDDVLRKIAPYLDEASQLRALTSIAARDPESRRQELDTLAPFVRTPLLPVAVAIARTIGDENGALMAGAALAPKLDAGRLDTLLWWMPRLENDYVRARALAVVLPRVRDDALHAARSVADGITGGTSLAEVALPALALRLSGAERAAVLEKTVEVTARMDDPDRLVQAFTVFVPQLRSSDIGSIVDTLEARLAERSDRPNARVTLLATAADYAGRKLRASLIARAFALVEQIDDDDSRADALGALVGVLDSKRRSLAARMAEDMTPFERASVYAALAASAKHPQEAHDMALHAMEYADRFAESDVLSMNEQAEIIASRAFPYVLPTAHKAALGIIGGFESTSLSASALTRLAERLDRQLLSEANGIARGYPQAERARPLAALALRTGDERLQIDLLAEALDAALTQETDLLHDATLEPVALQLSTLDLDSVSPLWRRALDALSDRPRPSALAGLRSLAPLLLHVEGDRGARECFDAIGDVRGWWP